MKNQHWCRGIVRLIWRVSHGATGRRCDRTLAEGSGRRNEAMFELHWNTNIRNGVAVADTRRQLHVLSDHQLHDIGLTRGQIDDVARGLVKGGEKAKKPITDRLVGRGLSLTPLLKAYRTA
jgi:uncharacterized protein YjiS (DUF1127 family)